MIFFFFLYIKTPTRQIIYMESQESFGNAESKMTALHTNSSKSSSIIEFISTSVYLFVSLSLEQ